MNRTSEIEHILICLKEHIALSDDEDNLLLDYITNLQQENERLKDNAIHNDKVVDKARWNEMIYKSILEKAVKYYKMYQQECVIGRNRDGKLIKDYYLPAKHSKVLLNILQN